MSVQSDLSLPVYKKLRNMILHRELKPGEKLYQEKLAEKMGVSRTPLAKALQMLEFDYLVESIPRRGMYVKKFSVQEIKDIYEVREGIEAVAVRLAVERASVREIRELQGMWEVFQHETEINEANYRAVDELFHRRLVKVSRNNFLIRHYVGALQAQVMHLGLSRHPVETLPEHLAIVDSIVKGDPVRAEEVMRLHVRKAKEFFLANYK